MNSEIITYAIMAIAGALATGLFRWLISRKKTSVNAETQFRQDVLKRLRKVEKEQKELEHVVMTWKGRYWSLYTWLVNFCLTNGITAFPPSFHEMKVEDLKERFKQKGGEYETATEDT